MRYMQLIRTNKQVVDEEYADAAQSVLDKYASAALIDAQQHGKAMLEMAARIATLEAAAQETSAALPAEIENQAQDEQDVANTGPGVDEEAAKVDEAALDSLLCEVRDSKFSMMQSQH